MRYRHLDHGYGIGWGFNTPGVEGPTNRPHLIERLHASLQYYPPKYIRPSHLREMAAGSCVAIQVHAGTLALRIFRLPAPELVESRIEYFLAARQNESNTSLCTIIKLRPGEMM